MSWSKEEWKQDLSPKVLQNITTLENGLEMLQKHSHQQQVKLDGYMALLDKEKNNFHETKTLNTALQNEIQELMAKKSNLETKQEKLLAEVRSKENSLTHTEEILEKLRQKLKTETSMSTELQRSLQDKKFEAEGYAERSEKLTTEVVRLKQEKVLLVKEKEGLQNKVAVLEKDNDDTQPHERRLTPQDENENVLAPTTSSGEIIIDMLKKENSSLIRDLEDITKQRDQLRTLLEERDRDVERARSKVTNLSVELHAAQESLKERGKKIHRLELTIETNGLNIMKLEREVKKSKANANERKLQVAVKQTPHMDEGNEIELKGKNDATPKLFEREKEKEKGNKRKNENEKETESEKEMSLTCQVKEMKKEEERDEQELPEQRKENEGENGISNDTLTQPKGHVASEKDVDELEDNRDNNYKEEKQKINKEMEGESDDTEARQSHKDDKQTQIAKNVEDATENGRNDVLNESKSSHINLEIISTSDELIEQDQQEPKRKKSDEKEIIHLTQEPIEDTQLTDRVHSQEAKNKVSTLEELMSLFIESLKGTREIKPMESCVVQNLNQVIALAQDSELRHERIVQATQTMTITQYDEECQTYTPNTTDGQKDLTTTAQDDNTVHNNALDQEDSFQNLTAQHHFSQIQDALYNLQYEHERISKSADECADIVITVREGLSMPELSVTALVNRLASQINSIGDASERCNEFVEMLAREMSDLLSMKSNAVVPYNDVPSSRESISSEMLSADSVTSLKKDLSWDNFESDHTFLQFKNTTDEVLKEMDVMKEQHSSVDKTKTSSKTPEEKKCRKSDSKEGQVEGYLESSPEKCCENDPVIESIAVAVDETNSLWFDRTQALFAQLKNDLLKIVHSQIEISINRCAKTVDKQQQDVHDIWVIVDRHVKRPSTRCAKKKDVPQHITADDCEFTDDSHATLSQHSKKCAKKHEISHETETSEFASKEGEDAYQVLENVKKRISHVQKIIQHLLGKSQVVQDEKDKAYAHIDRLSSHVLTLHSDHELQCKELEGNLKSMSDRQISLQRKCSHLEQERNEIDSEMRTSTREHQRRELELFKVIKKVRKMQNESEQAEAKLKSENEELRKQNCSIWRDYEAASTELDDKKRELKKLMGSMKNTEHSLISLFNTIGNIDDFLQRVREMNLFK